jgi:predicted RNase H-like HicB family nuclease
MIYVGILDGEKDVWGVRIPDAPGVHGGGKTPEAAVEDAASALAEVARVSASRGHLLPPPRSWADIRQDRAVMGDLKEGEILVMIEMRSAAQGPDAAVLPIERSILDAVDRTARAHGVSPRVFIEAALRDKLAAV